MSDSRKHELKSLPTFFQVSWVGHKPFEIRKDDRNFQERDEIVLREYDPTIEPDDHEANGFTGREIEGVIEYITSYQQQPGFVVFSWRETSRTE